jgi:hypothetical protein
LLKNKKIMNVFKYVAESNPNGAVSVINSFGYDVTNTSDLGKSLSELVAEVGEPAFKKVMDNHPDKDVILELYASENTKDKQKECGCSSCLNKQRDNENLQYLNATGKGAFADEKSTNSSTNTHLLANQTNVILVVSALFIATALILKK